MSRSDKTEVLVVGAGPVGMLTALLLAEEDIHVKIIDKEARTATRSYACVLHPATLQLLGRLGLAEEVCALGWPVNSVAFFEGESRRAEMSFAGLPGDFRHALVIPQGTFEDVLEKRLLTRSRTKILWNHRLTDLRFEDQSVVASIDKLTQSAKGYGVADWDWVVQKRLETTAAFVVGADGHDSVVRSRLGIEYECLAGPEHFSVFEFETTGNPGYEVRVAMDDTTVNVLWPLPDSRCRWTFQLVKTTEPGEFPDKDREAIRFLQQKADDQIKLTVERLARKRAPWFKGDIKDVQWSGRIRFEHRLAKQFGKDRTWLAGDAAHQTGPVGAQSMNAGLLEAEDLAGTLGKILRKGSPLQTLENYGRARRAQWEQLLGRKAGPGAGTAANPWFKEHAARTLSCLPALGEHLGQLISQVGFDFEAVAAVP